MTTTTTDSPADLRLQADQLRAYAASIVKRAEALDQQAAIADLDLLIGLAAQADEDDRPDEDQDENWPIGSTMECYSCPGDGIAQKIVAIGPIINQRADPTQSYRLACGHLGF